MTWPLQVHAQAVKDSPPPEVFTLEQALQYALDHYPTVRAALEQVNASDANVSVAKSAYLPRLDALWQSNRATANNIFGQVLPQSVIPAMSGPVLPSASSAERLGQRGGRAVLVGAVRLRPARRHGPSGGGRRRPCARRRSADAARRADTRSAPRSWPSSAPQQAVAAPRPTCERRDRARARGAHPRRQSAAPGRRGLARRCRAGRRADARDSGASGRSSWRRSTLARVLGDDDRPGRPSMRRRLLDRASAGDARADCRRATHPLAQSRQAAVDVARAQEDVLSRRRIGRGSICSRASSRAAAAPNPNGQLDGGVDGLGLERANWAAGVQVVFPNVFDFASLRARRAAAAASTRAETRALRRGAADGDQPAAGGGRDGRRRPGPSPRTRRCNSPRRSRAKRRRAPATRPAWPASSKWPMRRACSRRPSTGRSSRAIDVWRALLAQAVAQGDLDAVHRPRAARPRELVDHVADPRRAPPPDHRSWSRCIAVALTAVFAVSRMRADIFPDLDLPVIYVAQPYGGMSPAQMEGYITYYYEYHFLYINGIQSVESKSIQNTGAAEADVPSGHRHGRGAGADDRLRQSRARLHAAGHGRPVHHAVRCRQRAGRLPGVLERDAAASARFRTSR